MAALAFIGKSESTQTGTALLMRDCKAATERLVDMEFPEMERFEL
jgi:hypothetical protein